MGPGSPRMLAGSRSSGALEPIVLPPNGPRGMFSGGAYSHLAAAEAITWIPGSPRGLQAGGKARSPSPVQSPPVQSSFSPDGSPRAAVSVKRVSKEDAFARGWQLFHESTPLRDNAVGIYVVIRDVAVEPGLALGRRREDIIAVLPVGTVINVLAVAESDRRIRGRIEHPVGWISLLDLEDGYRWVQKQDINPRAASQVDPQTMWRQTPLESATQRAYVGTHAQGGRNTAAAMGSRACSPPRYGGW